MPRLPERATNGKRIGSAALRLVHTLIAALLAIAAGVFPVAALSRGAAMSAGGHHVITASALPAILDPVAHNDREANVGHYHRADAAGDDRTSCGTVDRSATPQPSPDQPSGGTLCCQLACHLVLSTSSLPRVTVEQLTRPASLTAPRDEQAASAPRARIERPPRPARLA